MNFLKIRVMSTTWKFWETHRKQKSMKETNFLFLYQYFLQKCQQRKYILMSKCDTGSFIKRNVWLRWQQSADYIIEWRAHSKSELFTFKLETIFIFSGDSLEYHNGKQFSTKDVDRDSRVGGNCAVRRHGAWWYGNCATSNLNGEYLARQTSRRGVSWWTWKGSFYSLKRVEMKIKPLSRDWITSPTK